jgi:glutamyl-Q tRNA(Asp) synthetase
MIVTRFAPSPTGRLNLGHAYSAVLGHRRAKESGGKFLLRMEDLDPTRSQPEFVEGIVDDLRWLGVDWDEPIPVVRQIARSPTGGLVAGLSLALLLASAGLNTLWSAVGCCSVRSESSQPIS